jgi:oxygen-dependent protoporphyrinogen oxidase
MRVAVLGGGVTGLTAAWRLAQAGHTVSLLESGPRLGGSVHTELVDGWLVEAGPNSIRESAPEVGALLGELGLGAERVESAPAAARRYLAHRGALVPLPAPSSPRSLMGTPLLSLRSKARIARELARRPVARTADVSVGDFMRDHFGAQIVERAIQPFVSGYCAGDPERLSTRYALPWAWEAERATGSLLRAGGLIARERRKRGLPPAAPIASFRGGMKALPEALAGRLGAGSIHLRSAVRSLAGQPGAGWRVCWDAPDGTHAGEFDRVIAALPAAALAGLEIGPAGERPLSGLAAIEYPPVASVCLGFRREQVAHPLDGFGALVPATEGRSILGIVFSSSLFPARVPAGHVALTVLAGGSLQPEIAQLSADKLVARVCADLGQLVGAQGRPVFTWITVWPRAIPQYNLGHGLHLEAMAQCERNHPGLFIGGSVRNGISVPDCLLAGDALARRALVERGS